MVAKNRALRPECTPWPHHLPGYFPKPLLSQPRSGRPSSQGHRAAQSNATHLLSDGVRVVAGGAPECSKAQAARAQERRVFPPERQHYLGLIPGVLAAKP